MATVLRNKISGNKIDMVNFRATDIGIYLDDGSNNNSGTDNDIVNAGIKIRDLGSGNTVNMAGG